MSRFAAPALRPIRVGERHFLFLDEHPQKRVDASAASCFWLETYEQLVRASPLGGLRPGKPATTSRQTTQSGGCRIGRSNDFDFRCWPSRHLLRKDKGGRYRSEADMVAILRVRALAQADLRTALSTSVLPSDQIAPGTL